MSLIYLGHTDSCRFEGSVPILVTFKGASTLFYNASVEQREKFIDLQSQYLDDLDNIKLNVELSNIFTPYEGNFVATPSGSAFSCGDEQTGVLHTHPPVYEERIFLAIVPGGKSDIDLLYEEFEL